MAKGQVPKHAFKKGESGNPSGRPKLPEDIVESRKLNKIEVARIFNKFMNYSFEELKAVVSNPQTKTMELLIGKIMAEAIKNGDHARLNFILDRMIGKVSEKVEITGDIKNEITVVRKDLHDRIDLIKGKK